MQEGTQNKNKPENGMQCGNDSGVRLEIGNYSSDTQYDKA